MPVSSEKPLVSVIILSFNSEKTINRCVEAVLGQTYEDIEFIIQDGGSTDRTLDIIHSFKDDRIKLVSEPDRNASDGYHKALMRCTGDVIGLCWSDEQYFPYTVEWGVEQLRRRPEAGGIYGAVYCSDRNGAIAGDLSAEPRSHTWDLERALCWEMIPNYVSSFFRTRSLEEAGFFAHTRDDYAQDDAATCIMYNYFSMVAVRQPVVYVPHYVAKFAFHPTQLSAQPSQLQAMVPQLMKSFDMIAATPGVPDFVPGLRQRAYAGFHLIMVPGLMKNGYYDEAKELLLKGMGYEYNPGFLQGVINGSIYILNEKWKFHRTIEFIDMALERGLLYSTLYYFKALAYERIGDITKAVDCMKQQVAAFPEDRNSVYRLVKLQLYKLVELPEVKVALEAFGLDGPRVTNLREYADRVHKVVFTKSVYRKGIFANQHGPESMLGLYDLFLAYCGEEELRDRLEADRCFMLSYFDI